MTQSATPKDLESVLKPLYARINALAKVETKTKEQLALLCNDLLAYHMNGGADVRPVNKLVSVLSPANKKVTRLFFQYFLPWRWDSEKETFGGKIKDQDKILKAELAIASFLKDGGDIWSWQADHVNIDAKPVNYAKRVSNSIKLALEKEVDKAALIGALIEGGLSVEDLVKGLEALVPEVEETRAKAE